MSRRFCPCHAVGHAATARSGSSATDPAHRLLGYFIDTTSRDTSDTRLQRVRRERLGVEIDCPADNSGAANTAFVTGFESVGRCQLTTSRGDPRCCCKRDRRREPVNTIHIRHRHLMKQAPRVWRTDSRYRPALPNKASRTRAITSGPETPVKTTTYPAYVQIYILEIVLPTPANPHETVNSATSPTLDPQPIFGHSSTPYRKVSNVRARLRLKIYSVLQTIQKTPPNWAGRSLYDRITRS